MFRYPDFFKVGISESGNHDNREYEDDWAEKWQGLLEKTSTGGATNYDNQANQLVAKNLKGHLLLAHGTMDNNVPPYNTLLVVNELIKANKDFDLLLIPNVAHGYGAASNYMTAPPLGLFRALPRGRRAAKRLRNPHRRRPWRAGAIGALHWKHGINKRWRDPWSAAPHRSRMGRR